ncbi:MAG: hypothetical protein KJ709_07375, partial [Nanoarchaeota archaeon]|nr:hypothetical protein [Nanoarchaeota archaeon]
MKKTIALWMAAIIVMLPVSMAVQMHGFSHEPTEDGELFMWNTDVPASSRIDYGLNDQYGLTALDEELKQEHILEMTGLLPGRNYEYKAQSCSQDCDIIPGNFSALKAEPPVEKDISAVSATIAWQTNRLVPDRVIYGTAPDALVLSAQGIASTEHSITLTALEGNTHYFYQIYSGLVPGPTGDFWTSNDLVRAHVTLDMPIPALTNEIELHVSGSTEAESKLKIYINGDRIPARLTMGTSTGYQFDVGPDGRFDFIFNLRRGTNIISFENTDKDQNIVRHDFETVLDTDGPELNIAFPTATTLNKLELEASVTQDSTIQVFIDKPFEDAYCDSSCGTTELPWCCMLNQQKHVSENQCQARCELQPDYLFEVSAGNFNLTVPKAGVLSEGEHNISVVAVDPAGNEGLIQRTVAVDTTPPEIDSLQIEEVIFGLGTDGDFTHSGPEGTTVHFQVIRINGTTSEPATVRITNLGEADDNIKYNHTERNYYRGEGDLYGVGMQGDPADLFYDFDETANTVVKDGKHKFETEVILMPGTNHLAILAQDRAGNVNVRQDHRPAEVRRVIFDGGSDFWMVSRHSVMPNYVIAADIRKGEVPIAMMV